MYENIAAIGAILRNPPLFHRFFFIIHVTTEPVGSVVAQVGKDYKVHFADRLPNALRPSMQKTRPFFRVSPKSLACLQATIEGIIELHLLPWWFTGWWFQIFFYVYPYLGKIPYFQRGWNHQPVVILGLRKPSAIVFLLFSSSDSRILEGSRRGGVFFIACQTTQMIQLAPKFDWNSASFEASNFHKE